MVRKLGRRWLFLFSIKKKNSECNCLPTKTMNVTYELSLLNSIVSNQARELAALKQQVAELSAPKQHDYSKCWKTKDGTLIPYNEMSDFHLFCAIQRVWSTSPSMAPLLKEAQARWEYISLESNRAYEEFVTDTVVASLLSIEHIDSPRRTKAIRLAYRSLKQAGVDVALTI
jgi:hypothetical protein